MAIGARQNHVAAEVKMRRTQHAGSFLVLEGLDDLRFWRSRSHDGCRLIDGHGKKNVVLGLQRLDGIGFNGALGVVDSNYDYLADVPLGSNNLLSTDAHDLECMLCRSSALEAVLAEFGNDEKISRFRQSADVRAALLERCLIFGRLRWAAQGSEPSLRLPATRAFVDERSWSVDEDGLIDRAAGMNERVDVGVLRRHIADLPPADPWHVVHGHDMLEILRVGLRNVLGDLPAGVGVKEIARGLRLAMPPDDLQSTRLWRDMQHWERLNKPYLVLAA